MTSDLNREFWDERVPIHTASDFYDVEGFKAGREPLQSFELEDLGDVSGRLLVHLQCHFGLDTLAWARLEPAEATAVQLTAVIADGKKSVTAWSTAVLGPALRTTRV